MSVLNIDTPGKQLVSAVMFGGGSVMRDNDAMCQHAWMISTRLSEMGWCILTGGGQEGIMKWASVGAKQGGNGRSVAITCEAVIKKHILAYGTIKSAYYDESVCVLDIRDRKQLLLEYSDWHFFFPGSIGTFDELFGCLRLLGQRTHTNPLSKVVFIGVSFWTPLLDVLRALIEPVSTIHTIKKLFAWKIVDTVNEVMNIIRTEYGGPVDPLTQDDTDGVVPCPIVPTTNVRGIDKSIHGVDFIQQIIMSEHQLVSISGDINHHVHSSKDVDILLDVIDRLHDRACCIVIGGDVGGLTPLLKEGRRITLSISPDDNSHITDKVITSFLNGSVTDVHVNMKDMTDLKHWHMRNSEWHLFFPGGLDTMDEVFTCLCINKQRTKSHNTGTDGVDIHVPPMNRIIFVGVAFWQPILSVIKEITKTNCKDEANVYCYNWQIVDTAEELMAIYVARGEGVTTG
jgi:uncharacterized protein (TIGR00730 family)